MDRCEELRRKIVLGTTYSLEMGKYLPVGELKDMEKNMWFRPDDKWYSEKWKEFIVDYNRLMAMGYSKDIKHIFREKGIRISLVKEYAKKCMK